MVEIASAADPVFAASRLEDVPGKSYSVETVKRLRSVLPHSESIYFVIGADAFAEIQSWFHWQELVQLVTFAVVGRPGADYVQPEGFCIRRVTGVNLPVSSSEIRRRLAAGDTSVDLPPGVLDFIRARRLYQTP